MKDNKDIQKALRGFYETQIQSLNGIMDKVPESLKSEVAKFRDNLNTQLAALPPLEQVPAALDASYTMQALYGTIERLTSYAQELLGRLGKMSDDLAAKTTSLNGFEEKVKNGELVTKETAKTLADQARDAGLASLMPQIVANRKATVEACGLPMPKDDVLNLGGEQFGTRLNTAKENLAKLTAKGLKLNGKGSRLVEECAWLEASEFNGRMDVYSDIIGGEKSKTVDPLLGNPGGDPKNSPENKKRLVV